ncbi:MAG: HTTM domain-containing protein, partial [Bdellovibrionota bacterium]
SFLLSIGLFGILTGYRPNLASAGPYRNFCLPIYFLFLLSVTPAIGRIRGRNLFTKNSATEDTYAWPISLLKLTVYMVFFSAAIAKLRYGTQWMDGQTLRTFLLEQNVFRPGAPGLALAAYPAVCQALSVLVVVGELSAPLVLLFPALEIPFVVGALLFHASVRIFLSVDGFFLFFLPCYLIFLSGDRARFLRKLIFRPRTP